MKIRVYDKIEMDEEKAKRAFWALWAEIRQIKRWQNIFYLIVGIVIGFFGAFVLFYLL